MTSNNPQLPRGTIGFALGVAGMLVSLYYSIMFIAGTANGVEIVIGVVFALTLDYAKIALASEAIMAMASLRLFSAVIYSLIVIALYCLSMLAATFMLTSHGTSAAVTQSDDRIALVSQQITEKRAELALCNPAHLTKCVNPRTAELTALQADLAAAQNVSQDVLEAKNTAATWEKMAVALGTQVEDLQVKLAFSRAILLEVIAPILVSIFLTAYRNRNLKHVQNEQSERVVYEPVNTPAIEETRPKQIEEKRVKQSAMNVDKLAKKD